MVTYAGEGLHQRTSASALRALGLSFLIARTVEDYEAIAVRVARNSDLGFRMRLRLLCSRPMANYTDLNPNFCLWQTEAGVQGAGGWETGLRLAHEVALVERGGAERGGGQSIARLHSGVISF